MRSPRNGSPQGTGPPGQHLEPVLRQADLRRNIRAETTKVESYNDFLDWIGFGGPVLTSGDPIGQAKQVKYMDLVANVIMCTTSAT